MPWKCTKCASALTFRRDKICQGCRPRPRRGAHNALQPRVRLWGKTRASVTSSKFVVGPLQVVRRPAGNDHDCASWYQFQQGLEHARTKDVLQRTFHHDSAMLHDVLAFAHGLLAKIRKSPVAPFVYNDRTLFGLLSVSIANSRMLMDPDMYRYKCRCLLKLKQQEAIAVECRWVNIMETL